MLHPAMHRPSTSPAAAPLGYTNGQLEALKWLGLGSMLVDHIGRHLLGAPQDGWVFALGRFAFPLFALVLGLNLARVGDREARARRTAHRLLVWGAIAVLPSIAARGDPQMLNVLVTLGLGAAVCWLLESHAAWGLRALGCVAIAAVGWYAEFGTAGVFLVPAVYLAAMHRQPGLLAMAFLLLGGTAALNGQFGGWPAAAATLASWGLAAAVRPVPLAMPRWQLFFYLFYPVHLALIGAWKSVA